MKKYDFNNLSKDDLIELLATTDKELIQKTYDEAYKVKLKYVGNTVYFRGLVEFSNVCVKDCLYCGIRKGNDHVDRYSLSKEEILASAKWAYDHNYASLVLQSGERSDEEFVSFVESVLTEVTEKYQLGITLSLGEQTRETYRRWRAAGASRYLLRIESSNREIFKLIHPDDCDFDKRLQAIYDLRAEDYQVGTGVMIGLPTQTAEDLANDILFFKEHDIDMIGMGPYIVHHDTPLAKKMVNYNPEHQLELGLKMVALTRLYLKDVNIASTTALQTLDKIGRELGLLAGGNICMPVVYESVNRKNYLLYDNKPALTETSEENMRGFEKSIHKIGENIGYGVMGNSKHYKKRKENG
ncbi:MAG: [FeFe] hydrogenase H-cluster radical SAM maturase HydE [Candidatus Cloacimonetes bacterium 4572_65]|nr:MAG: [FeFe] hydrogenase H-cluster radical SAM maturase HydE [Candidatus Cloacimonetes bacterium 4572_65]